MSGETNSSVVITKKTITRRSGDVETSSSSSSKSNYQVYRGLSPTTSNRMEQRMKELEEALEQERESHARTEKELTDAHFQIDQLNDRVDEAENQTSAQIDANRKKDQDVMKAKKEVELLNATFETNEATLKKRNQEVINDLTEQLSRANKQKSKAEKEKSQIQIEVDGLVSQLDSANKAKSSAESKLENLEDQLRKLKTQVDELTRSTQDLKAANSRLTSENSDLQRQLHDLETNQGNVSRTKQQLQHALDEAKSKLDDESKARTTLEIQFNNLQADFDNLRSQLDDEAETGNSVRAQLTKAQAEYQALKVKYDREVTTKTEELEEVRRKLMARCAELEGLAEQAKNKANKLEKEKSKLTIEIRDITIQLDDANGALNDHAKRLKTSEQRAAELQKRSEELNNELQTSNGENVRLLADITRMKVSISDQQAKIDTLTREHSKLTESLHESESQNKDLSRSVTELSQIRILITNERDAALSELADSRETARDLQARLDSANNSVNQIKTEYENRLREKEDELESIRKLGGRSVEELQRTIIEMESKFKAESNRLKKKYESEHHEIIIQIDNLNRSNADFAKSNKHLATKLKETESQLETERHASLEARESTTVLERKLIGIQTELEDVRSLLEAADKARKNADNDLSEATSHISELKIQIQTTVNDKRRMESDIQGMHRDLDEAINARRASDERADRLQLPETSGNDLEQERVLVTILAAPMKVSGVDLRQFCNTMRKQSAMELNRVSDQLRQATESCSTAESSRRQLEIHIKELTVKLEEAEMTKDGKKPLAKLQARVHELEMELDSESRRGRDAAEQNKKLLKQLNELRAQADEDHRLVAELSDQVNTLQTRMVNTKRQLEESEEVLGITMNKYRKTQQMLEEAERRADRAEKNVTLVRHTNITSGAGGARGTRAVSVSRETTRIVRV